MHDIGAKSVALGRFRVSCTNLHHIQAAARRRVQGRIAHAIHRIDIGARSDEHVHATTREVTELVHAGAIHFGDADVERRPLQRPTRLPQCALLAHRPIYVAATVMENTR